MQYFKQILIIQLFFLIYLPLHAQTEILKTPITISIENKPVKDILRQISEKTGIGFSFGSEVFKAFPNKSVSAKDKALKDILNELFAGEKIAYKVVGNQIVILVLKDFPRTFTISGFVKEQGSSETLIGVNVYVPSMQKGTASNTYGFYSLTLPLVDSLTVIYSFVGYKPVTKRITAADSEINIFLEPGTMLNEVVVNADAVSRQSENVQMSTISVPVSQIKNVPTLLGEKDVFKVLQLMPGVQKGMEGSSGIYVRGGGPDQNLIILDDAIVYNASHLFGFFSLFNGDALKSVELTKGGFPARYGGRLSSVIDMNMKEGNKEAWHGEGGIGLISSRLTVEGPLKKNKSSILLSGRRSYLDMVSKPFIKSMTNQNTEYFFYDLNAKVNYDFGRNNKLYLSGYFGKDFYSKTNTKDFYEKAGLNWLNSTATLRWNHVHNNQLFSNFSVIYSKYKFQVTDKFNNEKENRNYFAEYNSGITDYSAKCDFDYLPDPKHWIKTGINIINHQFKPYAYVKTGNYFAANKQQYETIRGWETAVYLEDTYQPSENLKINGGLRYTLFLASHNKYNYLEPRISIAYRFKNDFAVKSSFASMTQYVHLLSNTGISLPTDLWVPCNDKVGPQRSKQIALSFVKDYAHPALSINIEGYYKKLNHIIGYKEGATFLDIGKSVSDSENKWLDNITTGQGWSYGAEFFVQKKTGKFNGWIGYTLSWTKHQFDSLNHGMKFYPRYDRRHDISIVGIYKLNDRINLTATWVYGTGNVLSLAVDEYIPYYLNVNEEKPISGFPNKYPGNLIPEITSLLDYDNPKKVEILDNKNNFRADAYHRLDVGIQFHKQKKWGERTWEISVYNVYNRRNPFFYYNYYENEIGKLKRVSLFPIIPSITYSFKF